MRTLILTLLLTLPASAGELPKFLSGSWSAVTPDGSAIEEHWMEPKGGVMLGMSRTVSKSGKVAFEFIRIATHEGKLAYLAMPGGRPPTAFPLASMTDSRVVFENPAHDFPQRILYWRDGERLCARVEGTIDGKAEGEEWCWNRLTAKDGVRR